MCSYGWSWIYGEKYRQTWYDLITIGGVKPLAQFVQKVRITTKEGKKIPAVINATYNNGKAENIYADIGAYTEEDVYNLGINVGDMVTYTTSFEEFTLPDRLVGKAFDDRIGCFVMGEVLKELRKENLNCNIQWRGWNKGSKDINTVNKSRYSICNRCSMC